MVMTAQPRGLSPWVRAFLWQLALTSRVWRSPYSVLYRVIYYAVLFWDLKSSCYSHRCSGLLSSASLRFAYRCSGFYIWY